MKAAVYLRNEHGTGLTSTVLVMSALLAATVVGVGVGRHMFLATELQTVAEVAATAAASAKLVPDTTDGAAIASAQTVVEKNQVDGNHIPSSNVPAPVIEFGNFSGATFAPGGMPTNAARATARATVKDLFPISTPQFSSGSDGNGRFTVTKTAVATFTGLGSGKPVLPIALCSACFTSDCFSGTCLRLNQAPNSTNNAAWTSLTTDGASKSTVLPFFPAPCGGGASVPRINVGTVINMTNGLVSPLLDAAQCMVCQMNTNEFLVPVFKCNTCGGSLNGSEETVGFATIVIDSFNFKDGKQHPMCSTKSSIESMNLHEVLRTNTTGSPGGGAFGTGFVSLVG
jgi:hypothetical protein